MKAVISKNQFNRIKNFINETKEIKKDEVIGKKKKSFPDLTGDGEVTKADILKGRGVELDEKKKLSKKQLRTFDIDNDGKPFEPRDLAALRASKKLSKELDEGSDCGCGEDKDDTRYMFFSNLEQMMRQAKMLLQMDEDMIEDLLNNGHDWAADHIAEAKNNMDQVFDFIMNEMNGEGEDDDEGMMYEGDAWASDGGYYSKPERNIKINRQDAGFINTVINDFKRSIGSEDVIVVDNSREGEINMTIINDLRKNWGVKFDYESEEGTDFYYLAPNQDMQNVNDGLENADQLFYDTIINEAMSLKKKAFVSKELKHHLDNKLPLHESEFRSGSQKHIELLKEVKELYNKDLISLNETDEFIVNEFDPNPIKVKGVGEVYLGLILEEYESDEQLLSEAVYQGRKVQLGKPFLTPDGPKKRSVYVRNDKGNVVKVNFGDPNMRIKKNIPARRKSFRARHKCSNPGPRFKSRYWSCRFW